MDLFHMSISGQENLRVDGWTLEGEATRYREIVSAITSPLLVHTKESFGYAGGDFNVQSLSPRTHKAVKLLSIVKRWTFWALWAGM